MPHSAERQVKGGDELGLSQGLLKQEHDKAPAPKLRVIQGGKSADFRVPDKPDEAGRLVNEVVDMYLSEGKPTPPPSPENSEATPEELLAHEQGLEPMPALSPEHNETTTESLINEPHLRAARDQLVSAWMGLRKYEYGLTGAALGIVARKSRETARVRYEAAQQAYKRVLWKQAQEVGREFGIIEKAKALVSAMEQMTDARAERVLQDMGGDKARKLYQLWQKMGEMNVGNIDAVKNILARQEDDGAWKGKAKAVGRFIARGMSLRSAIGAAFVGSGFWVAYAGWRVASGVSTGVGAHMLAREGMRVGSRELFAGSEAKVRREYTEEELAGMDDQQLGEIMQAYGARLGFHGEKLQGNERFERVKNAFLSRFGLVEENVQDRVDMGWGWDEETRPEEDKREAMMARKDAMLARLDGLAGAVEDELSKQEKQDRKHRLIAAASALAAGGAMMYFRPGGMGTSESVVASPEVVAAPKPEMAAAEAAPAAAELPHGVAGVYEIKSGQGLLHAANEFQKAQHDEIVAGIKTQHPEWFAKGEDYAIRRWRMEQVTNHGGSIGAAGEKYTEVFRPGAKVQLEFNERGYPHLITTEDAKLVSHFEHVQLRPRVEAVPPPPPKVDFGFEKWTDDRPVAFHVGGVRGEAVLHMDPETGTPHVEMHHAFVDPKEVDRFLDPGMEQALKEHLNLEGDPAALAVVKEQAYQLGEDLAAHEALLADLNLREVGNSPLAEAVRGRMREIVEETNTRFGDAHVLRPVSLPPVEEVGAAAGVSPVVDADADWEELQDIAEGKTAASDSIVELLKRQVDANPFTVNPAELKFPLEWTAAQQEAARRVMTYHQEVVRTLEKQLDAYETDHTGGPLLKELREKFNAAKADALTDGDYSVKNMLERMHDNKPGNIPAIELVPGTSTVVGSARKEAEGIFDGWVKS